MNRIVLMGRLTRDPELRRTPNGVSVASFALAVDRQYKAENGERDVDYIDCVAWRNTADFVAKYFSKGMKMAVEGRLQIRNWTDKDNNKRRSAEVIVDQSYFCEKRSNNGSYSDAYGNAPPPTQQSAYYEPQNEYQELEMDDDDLPF